MRRRDLQNDDNLDMKVARQDPKEGLGERSAEFTLVRGVTGTGGDGEESV